MDENNIGSLVRKQEQDYTSGLTTISEYVDFSLHTTVETIDAYLNSKHTSGLFDSKGREKPFFNIVRAAVNVWYRATDIDRKDIMIKPSKETDTVGAFMASALLHSWMKKEQFGSFLNEWGITLARYGSAVVKFVEQEGRLIPQVIPWNRLIVDSVDISNAPVIEKLYMTPAQLKQKAGYDQDKVQELIDSKTSRKTIGGQNKDTKADFIEVYEVHGELPLSYLTGKEEDEDTYVQQMHVVSFTATGKGKSKEYEDFTLYSGREAKNPYMITHLIKEDGRTISIGAVENLFEAQWMVNHTAKAIKDQLDLASKLIFQTADATFVGQNALDAIETGDILIHADGKPLTQIANNSHDITSLQNFGSQWKAQGNELTGVNDSLLGNNPPSGTAWRQTEALLQESHSLFEIMTESKGLYLEDMLRTYVIPHIKKKLNTKEEIVLVLGDFNIEQIETRYIKNKARKNRNNYLKEAILSGQIPEDVPEEVFQNEIKQGLQEQGQYRFFKPSDLDDKTWKEVLDGIEWELDIVITNESVDKQAVLTNLNTLFANLIRQNGQPLNPDQKIVFNEILREIGTVSPLQLATQSSTSPSGGQVGGGQVGQLPIAQQTNA